MSELQQTPFSFKQFHIDEFSIRREPKEEGDPQFNFTPSGYIDKGTNSFLLTIELEINDSNEAYVIKCNCFAYFTFNMKEGEELILGNFFYLNAPAIMFPYIRSYISAVTALSGLSAINLPLLNFPKKIGEDLKGNTQEGNSLEVDE
jgi:preprotein translocase subunit SecB